MDNSGKIIRTEALITRHHKLGESDMIVTFLTPEYGAMRAVAKGMRRVQSRASSPLDLLQHSRVLVRFGRNLHSVSQASIATDFGDYAKDALVFAHGCYITELAERFGVEGEPSREAFALALSALKALAQVKQKTLLCRWCDIRFLQLNGFAPQVKNCVQCNSARADGEHLFSIDEGGIVCSRCIAANGTEGQAVRVDSTLLRLLDLLLVSHWRKLDDWSVSPAVLGGLNHFLGDYIRHTLGSLPRSAWVLNQLNR